MVMREKVLINGAIDLRHQTPFFRPGDLPWEHVVLRGGPWDGLRALVARNADAERVSGDHYYRREKDGFWHWWYDEYE